MLPRFSSQPTHTLQFASTFASWGGSILHPLAESCFQVPKHPLFQCQAPRCNWFSIPWVHAAALPVCLLSWQASGWEGGFLPHLWVPWPKLILRGYLTVPVWLCYGASRAYHLESSSKNPPLCGPLVVPHRLAADARGSIHLGKTSQVPIWGDLTEPHLLVWSEWQLSSAAGQSLMCPARLWMELGAAEGLEDDVDLELLPVQVNLGWSHSQQRNRSHLLLLGT